MHAPMLITPPATLPVLLDEALLHLREDSSERDAYIEGLLEAAVSYLDGYSGVLGRALINQTWRQDFDRLGDCLKLPLLANAITSIVLVDASGAETVIADSNYRLQHNGLGSFVRMASGFSSPVQLAEAGGVQVTFIAGYGAEGTAVPASIRHAILAMVGHWYVNRETVVTGTIATQVPMSAEMLLAPFRRVGV